MFRWFYSGVSAARTLITRTPEINHFRYVLDMLRNALGNMQTSQEYFITIVYAKFGGQTECIKDNWKIVNCLFFRLVEEAASGKFLHSNDTPACPLRPPLFTAQDLVSERTLKVCGLRCQSFDSGLVRAPERSYLDAF